MKTTLVLLALLASAFWPGVANGQESARKPNVIVTDDRGHADVGMSGGKDIPMPDIDVMGLPSNGTRAACWSGWAHWSEKVSAFQGGRTMMQRILVAIVVLLAWYAAPSAAAAAEAQRPPNVVILFTDDQGYADVGAYGAKGFQTPNLDRMAAEGVRFTDFYAAAPVCSPSRAALLTGCYPVRVGIPRVLFPRDPTGLNPEEVTLAEVLKPRGYATACIGKWHLGRPEPFLPTKQGFDVFFGLPYSNDMSSDPENRSRTSPLEYPPLPLMRGTEVVEFEPDQSTLTRRYTEEGVAFITANKDRPFFLYLAHTFPHVPLHASEKFKGRSERGLYGDVIMEIDWSVGQILGALKRLGLDEQTLVVFTSDNGPWLIMGENGGSAGPLRAGTATTYEGGMRVPCILRWPGKIPAGSVCREVATAMDILPTVAKLAGARVPADRIIDGKDIWPLLADQAGAHSPHAAFFYYIGTQLQAVRSGKWKLHVARQTDQKKADAALYDLDRDIGETTVVAAAHPEVVERLMALVEQARDDLGDSLTQHEGKNVRPPGRVEPREGE